MKAVVNQWANIISQDNTVKLLVLYTCEFNSQLLFFNPLSLTLHLVFLVCPSARSKKTNVSESVRFCTHPSPWNFCRTRTTTNLLGHSNLGCRIEGQLLLVAHDTQWILESATVLTTTGAYVQSYNWLRWDGLKQPLSLTLGDITQASPRTGDIKAKAG